MLNIFIYIHTEYTLYIQYIFIYFTLLHKTIDLLAPHFTNHLNKINNTPGNAGEAGMTS